MLFLTRTDKASELQGVKRRLECAEGSRDAEAGGSQSPVHAGFPSCPARLTAHVRARVAAGDGVCPVTGQSQESKSACQPWSPQSHRARTTRVPSQDGLHGCALSVSAGRCHGAQGAPPPPQHDSGTVTSLLLCGRIVPPKDGHILVSRIHAYVTLHRKRNFQVRLNEGF